MGRSVFLVAVYVGQESHCLEVAFVIILRLMQTRSSAYKSRIHIIPDMRSHSFLTIKGALVIKPFMEANSFPALVRHITSHRVSRSLCDLHVQTARP